MVVRFFMARLSENYSSLQIPVALNELNRRMNIGSDDDDRLKRRLNCRPDERATKIKMYLREEFLNPELESITEDDKKKEADKRFHKSISRFIQERRLAKDLYKFISQNDYESFYTAIELFLGKEIFPLGKDNKHDLIACETKWAEYGARAYDYLLQVIDQVDPGRQTLSMPAEFSGMDSKRLLEALWRGDDRKSHDAILLLRLMLLEARINAQISDKESGAGYSGYFLKEIGRLTEYLSETERLFTEKSEDRFFEIYIDPSNSLRVYAYTHRDPSTGEGYGVIMEAENGDYYIREHEYDIRPSFYQARKKVKESLNSIRKTVRTFTLQNSAPASEESAERGVLEEEI